MARARSGLLAALKVLCIALFAVLVLVVVWQVFTRQVLQSPSAWTTTTAQYMFVWLGLFAMALVFGERGHVAVDIIAERAPQRLQHLFRILVQLATLLFSLLAMVWGGLRGTAISWEQTIPGFPFSVGQMYLALPIAGLMIAALATEDLVRVVRGERLEPTAEAGDEPPAGPEDAALPTGAARAADTDDDTKGR
ncbi:TRAP transporter small permease [Brachybacterium sp. GCM10030267]|uniref:TRAP transporter small permease n=1 Tax=Brachybacterium sp. GCM10030267 TaxID=3273381 RepID=UPI00361570D1